MTNMERQIAEASDAVDRLARELVAAKERGELCRDLLVEMLTLDLELAALKAEQNAGSAQ